MFRVNIKNQGKGCFDSVHFWNGDLAQAPDKTDMTDSPDLETIHDRLLAEPVPTAGLKNDEKRVFFPSRAPLRHGHGNRQGKIFGIARVYHDNRPSFADFVSHRRIQVHEVDFTYQQTRHLRWIQIWAPFARLCSRSWPGRAAFPGGEPFRASIFPAPLPGSIRSCWPWKAGGALRPIRPPRRTQGEPLLAPS